MPIPLVDLKAQLAPIRAEVDRAIAGVLDETAFIQGKHVADFEAAFACYTGATHCVGCSSGTSALQLALLALGIGPGDEVVTAAQTFIATAEAITQVGATPVFADIDPQSYTLDPTKVEAAITDKTGAIIAVHLYGQCADMVALSQIADRHGLKLVEDAAQAHGATFDGKPVGHWSDVATYSFYPGKNLGAMGDAGAVTTDDASLAETMRALSNHGRLSKYAHKMVGYNHRLDALQAAILSVKLQYLPQWTQTRQQVADWYRAQLAEVSAVQCPTVSERAEHVYHLFVVRLGDRDAVQAALREAGIATGVHYPLPLHKQPAYQNQYRGLSLPVTEQVCQEILSLPMYPELDRDKVEHICQALMQALVSEKAL